MNGERRSVVLSARSKSETSRSLQPPLLFKRHKEHNENKRGSGLCIDVCIDVCVCVCCAWFNFLPCQTRMFDAVGA